LAVDNLCLGTPPFSLALTPSLQPLLFPLLFFVTGATVSLPPLSLATRTLSPSLLPLSMADRAGHLGIEWEIAVVVVIVVLTCIVVGTIVFHKRRQRRRRHDAELLAAEEASNLEKRPSTSEVVRNVTDSLPRPEPAVPPPGHSISSTSRQSSLSHQQSMKPQRYYWNYQ